MRRLAGHSVPTETGYYVELNFGYFHELLGLWHVLPSHDTFSQVLRFMDFEGLSASLGESIGLKMKRGGEKENEISCLPEFLGKFNLKNTHSDSGCNRMQQDRDRSHP